MFIKKIYFFFLLLISVNSFSQNDDIPNYRSTRENFKKMLDKDIRADLASYSLAGIDESLTKEQLQNISSSNSGDDFIEFKQDSFYVKIVTGSFEKEKHKLLYYNEKYLIKIDNKPFWGTNYSLPKKKIFSVTITIGKDTIKIPATAYFDLYEPVLSYYDKTSGAAKTHSAIYLSKDGRKIYIYMINGEGAGSYEVTWIIQDKTYLRRVVDWGFQN